ncbi:MAG: cytochrome c [Proteobacteria bacterium]|nr:cytochrome c [Pseudomonadota bacterium]
MSEAGRNGGGVRLGLALTAGAAVLVALAYAALGQDGPASAVTFLGKDVAPAALELGSRIYAQNCASCHGKNLEGQPDWKRRLANGRMPAPPHDATGHSWHHSDQDLFKTTKEGLAAVVPGYESDMPVFGASLSDDEITAVLAYLKSTWPERQRAFQAEVTRNADLEDGP